MMRSLGPGKAEPEVVSFSRYPDSPVRAMPQKPSGSQTGESGLKEQMGSGHCTPIADPMTSDSVLVVAARASCFLRKRQTEQQDWR